METRRLLYVLSSGRSQVRAARALRFFLRSSPAASSHMQAYSATLRTRARSADCLTITGCRGRASQLSGSLIGLYYLSGQHLALYAQSTRRAVSGRPRGRSVAAGSADRPQIIVATVHACAHASVVPHGRKQALLCDSAGSSGRRRWLSRPVYCAYARAYYCNLVENSDGYKSITGAVAPICACDVL